MPYARFLCAGEFLESLHRRIQVATEDGESDEQIAWLHEQIEQTEKIVEKWGSWYVQR